jgi:hypothetical protein
MAARAPKNRSRPAAFVRFFSATFGAGVIATQCPITRPKRRIQPVRYMPFALKLVENYKIKHIDKIWFMNTIIFKEE